MEVTWKTILYFVALFCLCFVGIPVHIRKTDATEEEFILFMKKYNKSYDINSEEYYKRLSYFRESIDRVKNGYKLHEGSSVQFGITKFSDLSKKEFQGMLLRHKPSPIPCLHSSYYSKYRNKRKIMSGHELPLKVDWRDKKVVSEVKDQKSCGACWAFSIIGTVESMHAILTGALKELSVQQVIDCAGNGNMGCDGGDTCTALKWIASVNVSILNESQYPLTLNRQKCQAPLQMDNGIHISSNYSCYNLVGNEEQLKAFLAFHGPLTAAVDATAWQDYLGGIIQYHCEENANHAVQIVGYDSTGPVPYYIVRNSWGIDFGNHGYIYIAIGSNLCGIAKEVSTISVMN